MREPIGQPALLCDFLELSSLKSSILVAVAIVVGLGRSHAKFLANALERLCRVFASSTGYRQ
jgi:hypothetical protein